MDLEQIKAELENRLNAERRIDREVAKHLGRSSHLTHVPRIECADGFKMSVQASEFHYCLPRDSVGPWHHVEIGYPTAKVEGFMPFAEDGDHPTDTVYGYVPLDLVVQAIADHGGFASPTH